MGWYLYQFPVTHWCASLQCDSLGGQGSKYVFLGRDGVFTLWLCLSHVRDGVFTVAMSVPCQRWVGLTVFPLLLMSHGALECMVILVWLHITSPAELAKQCV